MEESDYSTNDSALGLPQKWLALYEDFVTKNAGAVSQIESSLRSLTYIVPGMGPCIQNP